MPVLVVAGQNHFLMLKQDFSSFFHLTQSKIQTKITRLMCMISLIVFIDKFQEMFGHFKQMVFHYILIISKYTRGTPKRWQTPLLCMLFVRFPFFFVSFLLVTEKDKKTCFYAETNDFNQQMVCRTPVYWLKYTTQVVQFLLKIIMGYFKIE